MSDDIPEDDFAEEMPDPLPDFGPPPGYQIPKPNLPDIGDPSGERPAFPSDMQDVIDQSDREREADKHVTRDFHESEQTRHQWDRDFNEEILKTFDLIGRDLADDFYALQELRTRMENSRSDLADMGL